MEVPECPVCLQPYDGDYTIPRVLSCGHTACDDCLTRIPKIHPHTIRCPACTVLVKYPPQGPSALPKNIDLLRLIPSSSSSSSSTSHKLPKQPRNRDRIPDFVPRLWSDEFYSVWKGWVLPHDAVSMKGEDCGGSSSLLRGWFREEKKVRLLRVGSLSAKNSASLLTSSYIGRVMDSLSGMREEVREELKVALSMKNNGMCGLLGLWGHLKDGSFYLVGHRENEILLDDIGDLSEDGMSCFSMIAMGMCAAVIDWHKKGLIAGCLGSSCLKFDDFGNFKIDLIEILEMGKKMREKFAGAGLSCKMIDSADFHLILNDILTREVFVSPEVLLALFQKLNVGIGSRSTIYSAKYRSDIWSLGCFLVRLLVGRQFIDEVVDCMRGACVKRCEENRSDLCFFYSLLEEKASSLLASKFAGNLEPLTNILCKCLHYDPEGRPLLTDLWRCVRGLIIKSQFDTLFKLDSSVSEEKNGRCLVLGELCCLDTERSEVSKESERQGTEDDCEGDICNAELIKVDKDVVVGLSDGAVKFKEMTGHLDCITGLVIGGDFLFSSSFDKKIHVWSLQNFSYLHTFEGHQHKVMAIIHVDGELPMCISGDDGGGIYLWSTCNPLEKEPLNKWYEPKDWRFSGIHALAVADNGYLYSGSGDKTVKVWSLQDGSLICTLTGHNSVVSTLLVCNGVLYSGSWDGTIRLWSLSDHSLLTVLGNETPGPMASVLSLAADQYNLVAAHENGSVKVWRNDVFVKSIQTHVAAVFGVSLKGRWLFTGGWDKMVCVQELITGDEIQLDVRSVGSIPSSSVITSMLYSEGKLFVGYADRTIKFLVSSVRGSLLLPTGVLS